MAISIDLIKELRSITEAGTMDCKKALEESNGDLKKAIEIIREKGAIKAAQKAERVTTQGLVEAYVHGGRIGAMVEINCETDFVAKNDGFKELAHNIAMQIASMEPEYINPEDVPAERKEQLEEGQIIDLMSQPFIKDPSRTIKDIVVDCIAKYKENIKVARFVRYTIGGAAKENK